MDRLSIKKEITTEETLLIDASSPDATQTTPEEQCSPELAFPESGSPVYGSPPNADEATRAAEHELETLMGKKLSSVTVRDLV